MEKVLVTPQLMLTLLESCEEDSQDVKFFHAVRKDEKATQWNIYGAQKTMEEARLFLHTVLPNDTGENTKYQVVYAIHRIPAKDTVRRTEGVNEDFATIGLISLKPGMSVPIHDNMTTKTDYDGGILRLEIGYQFLPEAWGKGFATEACIALLEACRKSKSYFAPFTSLYVDAVVSPEHPASMRVLEKAGLIRIGLNEWEGEPIWLAGAMRHPVAWIYGLIVF